MIKKFWPALISFCMLIIATTETEAQQKLILYSAPDSVMQKSAAAIKAIDATQHFMPFVFTGYGEKKLAYRMLVPKEKSRKYPLVVVLHGSGAVGTDNKSQLGVLTKMWTTTEARTRFPAFVLAPQFPERSSNYVMDSARGVLTSAPQACLFTFLGLLDSMRKNEFIDTSRIYIIGFSMGGSTVLNAMALRPGWFAAGVSFSGIPDFNGLDKIKNTNLLLVHGNADTENPAASDELFFKEMEETGGKKISLQMFDGLKHEIPAEFFTSEGIAGWLFRHSMKPE